MNHPFEIVESVPDETALGLPDTRRTAEVWMEMIEGARRTLSIETFYFVGKQGSIFDSIIDAIRSAAERGVSVRLLTDAGMSETYPKWLAALSSVDNIETRTISWFNEQSGVLHAKYLIVDREELFVGSQNFDWRALVHIHELGIRVRNAELAERFERVFAFDWELASNGHERRELPASTPSGPRPSAIELPGTDGMTVRAAASPVGKVPGGLETEEEALIELLDEATRRIDVQLLLYSPTVDGGYYPALDNALRRAAGRGVSIRMIVSNWNLREPGLSHLKSLSLVPGIRIGISTIPEHSSGFVPFARVEHCKYLLVDDSKTWIATGNWSWDYFYSSRNLALIFDDGGIASTVGRVFEKSWGSTYVDELDPCRTYAAPVVDGPEN